jgi:4-diphosphocytidyl-2-C-methyl-D-erythritol kinase
MRVEKNSSCKVNLILNILGKRPDGFHELETVMHPVGLHDVLTFERGGTGIQLTCSNPELPVDSKNLVFRAAEAFQRKANISEGLRIYLEKKIPMAAGLGGGSGNAATTLLGLNELFDFPLSGAELTEIAAGLGSDIPFFLQQKPALGTGRGVKIQSLDFFPALKGAYIFLVHPGFGISTPWAYQQLANFPEALNGKTGRAEKLISLLRTSTLQNAAGEFYNSLEAPALKKYPLLAVFQEFFRENGAITLMSGSGSTTFAIIPGRASAENLAEKFKAKFGDQLWTAVLPLVES